MAFLRLASLASLLATALSRPSSAPHGGSGPKNICGALCQGKLGTIDTNWSLLCTSEPDGYCSLGAKMLPTTLDHAWQQDAPYGVSQQDRDTGDLDLFIFDNKCKLIGNKTEAFSSAGYTSSLPGVFSSLKWTVVVDDYNPPSMFGSYSKFHFKYSTWSGGGCNCQKVGSSTGAIGQQVRILIRERSKATLAYSLSTPSLHVFRQCRYVLELCSR